ncbi:MAG: ECF transporter S component [Ruminococcaceae bacterium]|nr:ECF transporter S component [Oscillospiraceae bacterium]
MKNSDLGKVYLKKLCLSAMFIAIGIILPFFTGQIREIGNMLLPMHIPVFLCGLICGWQYGGAVGLVLPILRSLMFGMPTIFPNALGMAAELAVYGITVGLIYVCIKRQNVLSVYIAMIPAMILGRIVWGTMQAVLLGISGGAFTWKLFFAGAFLNAVPGIALQLILVPAVMSVLHLTGVVRFRRD